MQKRDRGNNSRVDEAEMDAVEKHRSTHMAGK
jgi:hypothetical protein